MKCEKAKRAPHRPGAAQGAARPAVWRRYRNPGKKKLFQFFPGSVYGCVVAVLALIALGMTWSLGLVGCAPIQGSGYLEATSGASFPNARQSSLEISRLMRNAHYYKLMGRPELALKDLEQAHQQNPDNLKIVNILAQGYEELGQFETARKLYQKALTRNGPNPALANNLCFTHYLEGRYQEAETCFRQTLARDPTNEAARNNLGLLYCRLGRQDEARRLWQEVEGTAAAEYKTRQALASLGMADRAVYAQRTVPALDEVAAVSPSPAAATLAPQKVAMQLPAQPVPDNDLPGNMVQERQAPLKTSPVPAPPAAPEMSYRPASAQTPQTAQPVQKAFPPTPVAAVSPRPASPPSTPGTPSAPLASQQVALQMEPKPSPDIVNPGHEAQLKSGPGQAAPVPAPSAASRSHPAYLTCAELVDTAIEVRNGTPTPHLAREVRSLLSQEAFTVVKIGNHVDFGAAKTMIYYRAVAQRVAQSLQTDIFPMASLEQSDRLRGKVAVKVLLGHDLLENQDLMARLGKGEAHPSTAAKSPPLPDKHLAAFAAAETPVPANQAPQALPQAKTAPSQTPAPVVQTPEPHSFEPLTAAELESLAIEVLNGTHTPHLARRTRTLLGREGFSVARIGNYINFGAKKTIIYYRPEAQKVARTLGETLFPGAGLEPCTQLRKDIAVTILLGADLLKRPQLMARLAIEAR
jgi:Tfp pilus assembly protein PilF